ncbi:hypothetical protein ACFYY8_05985 [Streptosporangium sp. NPDC001559]|uniref:hypothetical protein n=1 Tax=Streptosporangium sp. NPDC001559 TaxID=3366187 RepID=UPI0036EEE126
MRFRLRHPRRRVRSLRAGRAPAAADRVVEATNGKITVPGDVERIVSISYATGALLDFGVLPVGTSAIDGNNPMELPPSQVEAAKNGKVLPVTYATADRYGTSIDVLDQVETILKGAERVNSSGCRPTSGARAVRVRGGRPGAESHAGGRRLSR